MERAVQDLKLKPAQKQRVRKILEETGVELAAATAEVRPSVEKILGEGEDRIREVLDAEQRKKFDAFANEGRRRWKSTIEKLVTPGPAPAQPLATPVP